MVIEKSRLEHYNTVIASLLPGAYTFDLGPLGQLSNWDTIKFSTFHLVDNSSMQLRYHL